MRTAIEKRPNGTYSVKLSLDDDMGSLMALKLMVVREDMAALLTERFQKAPERIYSEIMNVLLSEELNKSDSDQA